MDGQRIAQLREIRQLSQEELAELLQVHVTTLSRWENGHFEPKASAIQKLCAALHVTEAELLNGPAEDKIKIELIFGKMDEDEEAIDMTSSGNKFKLFMDNDGTLGIKGGAKFASLEDIDKFIADAAAELKAGFDFQVKRGALALAKV